MTEKNTTTNYLLVIITIILLISLTHILTNGIYNFNENNESNEIEYYDLEIKDITEVDCGTRCTEALNCSGFAYKPVEKACYLSKTGIIGKPIDSIYSDDYSKLDRRCSKANRITDRNRIDNITLTRNSVYMCSDGESNTVTRFQYANLGASALEDVRTSVFEKGDIDTSTPIEVSYDTMYIDWPRVRTEDLSIYPSILYDIPNAKPPETINRSFGFVESEKEFLGQYLLAHQCVANVPFYDCLKYCENNANCSGVEWNKALVKKADDGDTNFLYENVCCPKAVIKQIIPRRKEFDRGRFYVKKDLQNIVNRDKIILTKNDVDNSSIPINKRFDINLSNVSFNKNGDIRDDKLKATPGFIEDVYVYHNE
jgi:hypothetical protein